MAAAIEHVAEAGKVSAGKWTHVKNTDTASDSATIAASAAKIKTSSGDAAKKAKALLDLKNTAATSTSIVGVVVLNPQIVASTTTTHASTTTTTTSWCTAADGRPEGTARRDLWERLGAQRPGDGTRRRGDTSGR